LYKAFPAGSDKAGALGRLLLSSQAQKTVCRNPVFPIELTTFGKAKKDKKRWEKALDKGGCVWYSKQALTERERPGQRVYLVN
jgi:hypothetical protein